MPKYFLTLPLFLFQVWGGLVRAVLDPVFQSASLLIRAKKENTPLSVQESI